jgi:hypothetical protein
MRLLPMLHAILCYNHEDTVWSWTPEQDAAVMARLAVVQERLVREGRLGPSARLLPTKHAKTLHKDREPAWVVDGPFAETKEQLLGFYLVDCRDMDEAMQIASELGQANPGGSYEVRPLALFAPGNPQATRAAS